ncbi:MAG: thioesterase domain-containing protein, partial [Renibacterium salmoninarum]|nr:thioesterase domain-containing protein [Renibacterium salmoninarum]
PADLPVLGLQADFNRYGPHGEFGIRDLAAAYLHRIRSVQSHGPYRLLGWSFGGLVAHAVAEALEAIGETVEYLGILDAYPLLEAEAIPSEDWVLGQLLRLDTGDALAPKLAGAIRELDYAAIARAWKQHGGGLSDLGEEGLRRVVRVTRAHADMGQRFRPGQVNADIQLVVATLEAETPADPEQSWAAHTRGRVRAIPVPARHDDLLAPDEVRGYADALLAELKGPAHVAS